MTTTTTKHWPLSLPLSISVIMLASLQLYQSNASTQCEESYSCESLIIQNFIGSTYCYGYFSCYNAYLISNSFIECDGSYSCFESPKLLANHGIKCIGLSSCANVPQILIMNNDNYQYSYVGCAGDTSCANSNINITNGIFAISCHGFQSCANTTITSGRNIMIYGTYAGTNSIITLSGGSGVSFRGFMSAFNATVICPIDSTCFADCHPNAGCDYLNLLCSNESNGNYNNSDCVFDTYYNYEPVLYQFDIPSIALAMVPDIIFNGFKKGRYGCNDNSSYELCGGYYECTDRVDLIDINKGLCCSGHGSCYSIDTISTITIDTSYSIESFDIRCDGYYSCHDESNNIIQKSGGNVYLTAQFSGRNVEFKYTKDNFKIYGNNLICSGLESCAATSVYNAANIYCVAYYACQYGSFYNTRYNVFILAGEGAAHVLIDSADNVYCFGYYSCENTLLSNINNTLIAIGNNALDNTNVTNAQNVYCDGKSSCIFATIRGIGNQLIANGYGALRSATIISETNVNIDLELEELKTLDIYINMSYSDEYYIYCNNSDICNIYCLSEFSCENLQLSCHGQCNVLCDGYYCPYNVTNANIISYDYNYTSWTTTTTTSTSTTTTTMVPSETPNSVPSIIPSVLPTVFPTQFLSARPSALPSVIPSVLPTQIPSKIPSKIPSAIPSGQPTITPSAIPSVDPTIMTTSPLSTFNGKDPITTFNQIDSTSTASTASTASTTVNDVSSSVAGTVENVDWVNPTALNGNENASENGADSGTHKNTNDLSSGQIIGIVIGVFVAALILAIIGWTFFTKYKLKKEISFIQLDPDQELESVVKVN